MQLISPQYPWCTGVPRPVVIENMDEQKCWILYNTAPIVEECTTAAIVCLGFKSINHRWINDSENPLITGGLQRDSIYREGNKFTFLFHNEMIEIEAEGLSEMTINADETGEFFNTLLSKIDS